jgi:hypothetical protein
MKGEHFYCLQSRNTYIGFQGRGYASASGTPCSRLFARRPARRGVPPERPTARHSAAQRDLHWCWTGVSGWGGAPRGCPGGTGSGGATWKAEEQGDTGEVKLSSYRSGLRLVFQQGCLRASEAWQPMPSERGTAAFPDLTFLQLVFGYRTLEELRYAFVDCWVEHDDTQAALEALFSR